MKRVFWNAIRVIFSIIAVDIITFFLLLVMCMTDESVLPSSAEYVFYFLKWVCGFPLVLIDGKMPFLYFFEVSDLPSNIYFLIIANIILQTIIVLFLIYIVKSIRNRTLRKNDIKLDSNENRD